MCVCVCTRTCVERERSKAKASSDDLKEAHNQVVKACGGNPWQEPVSGLRSQAMEFKSNIIGNEVSFSVRDCYNPIYVLNIHFILN